MNQSFNAMTLLREFKKISERDDVYVQTNTREIKIILEDFTFLVNLANRLDELEELRHAFTVMFYHSEEGVLYPITLPPENSLLYEALVIVYNKLVVGREGHPPNTNLLYNYGATKYFYYPEMPEINAVHTKFLDAMRVRGERKSPQQSEPPNKQSDIPKPFEPPSKPLIGGKKYKRKSTRKSKRKSTRKSRR